MEKSLHDHYPFFFALLDKYYPNPTHFLEKVSKNLIARERAKK